LLDSAREIQFLCEAEIRLLEEGYPQSTLASDYIPKYRKAIETAIADRRIPITPNNSHHYIHTQRVTGVEENRFEHYALSYFKYDREVYESLDKRSANTNRQRQVSLRSVNPYDYLLKLEELLDATDKFAARKQAIAIAGLTGRRIGEVLAKGKFQLSNHPHLLRFEGHQKTTVAAYDIVTLIPAEQLLEYIEQFRSLDEIRPLLELEGEALTQAVNQLDVQINRECVKHLGSIVPPVSARATISIHNLRSLWGAIAVWLFCPDNQHEYPFIQHYLGHALDSNATGHYFRYQLVDSSAHPIPNKGVKLSQVGELPLFTDDAKASAAPQNQIIADDTTQPPVEPDVPKKDEAAVADTSPVTTKSDSKLLKLSYYQRDRTRLTQLLDALSPPNSNQQEKMAALLDWAERQLLPASDSGESRDEVSPLHVINPSALPEEASASPEPSADLVTARLPTPTPAPDSSPTPTATSTSPLELLVAQAVTDQARSLGVLASRVEALESQLSHLQQQRDEALQQLAQVQSLTPKHQQQLEHLQAENRQLRQELHRFEAIRRAFLGESLPESASPNPATALTDADAHRAIATTSSPKPQSSPSSAKPYNCPPSPRKGAAVARAEKIFHALVAWNQQHPDDTFAMNPWLLEGVFKVNRKAAKEFCLEFHDAIDQHHSLVGIDNIRSHNSRKNTAPLKAFVNSFSESG